MGNGNDQQLCSRAEVELAMWNVLCPNSMAPSPCLCQLFIFKASKGLITK